AGLCIARVGGAGRRGASVGPARRLLAAVTGEVCAAVTGGVRAAVTGGVRAAAGACAAGGRIRGALLAGGAAGAAAGEGVARAGGGHAPVGIADGHAEFGDQTGQAGVPALADRAETPAARAPVELAEHHGGHPVVILDGEAGDRAVGGVH